MAPLEVSSRPVAAGIDTRYVRVALVLLWLLGIASSALSQSLPLDGPRAIAAYGLLLLGAVFVTARPEGPLTPVLAWTVVLCAVLPALVIIASISRFDYDWFVAFCAYLAGLLTARGNRLTGSVASISILLGGVVLGLVTHQPAAGTVGLLALPFMATSMGWLWTLSMRWLAIREQSTIDAREIAAAASAESRRVEIDVRDQLELIDHVARPVLARIAQGEELDADAHALIVASEGDIRDRIRVPRLRDPLLVQAVWEARRRGVQVTLTDTGESVDDAVPAPLIAQLVAFLADPRATAITIRLPPSGRPGVTTVFTDARGRPELVPLDDAGRTTPAAR